VKGDRLYHPSGQRIHRKFPPLKHKVQKQRGSLCFTTLAPQEAFDSIQYQ
jgi:hypothetical protein